MLSDPLPRGRSQEELVAAQLTAIDAWNRARRAVEASAEKARLSREMRLDLARRQQARRREHDALLARSEQMLRVSGEQLAGRAPVRAVLAHRNAWLRGRVAERLAQGGVEVVGEFEDGADAAGTIVAEQPDVVFVEDLLPTMAGLEVVRRVRTFAAAAVTGAQVVDSSGIEPFVAAGAAAVFTRRVPPVEMAEQLLSVLASRNGGPVCVR